MRGHHSAASALFLGFVLSILAAGCARPQRDEAERIRRVENGLRPYSWALFGDEQRDPILERMRVYGVPGASVAVIQGGRLAWAKAYGVKDLRTGEPVTVDTLFQAASISKTLNAVAVLQRAERGRWRLDRDVNEYLKSWRVPENPWTSQEPLTISRLLNHTGGVSNFNDRSGYFGYKTTDPLPTVVQILKGEPPAKTSPVIVESLPGRAFRYSNGGTTILQLMLMDLEGKPYAEILQESVLDPLGMSHSLFAQPLPPSWAGAAATAHDLGQPLEGGGMVYPELAAGGLWTTPSDLSRFLIEMWLTIQGRSERVLSPAMAQRMISPFPDGGGFAEGFEVTLRGGEIYFGHRGGSYGFYSDMIINKSTGDGAIVMVNGGGDNVNSNLRREILISIAAEYGWPGYLPPQLEVAAMEPERARRFAGRYLAGEDDVVRIEPAGGALFARRGGASQELLPVSSDEMAARSILPIRYRFLAGPVEGRDVLKITDGAGSVNAPRLGEDVLTPAEILASGDVERALDLYREIRRRSPSSPAVRESRMNSLGYRLLREDKTEAAIAVFRLNVEWYPRSANVFDSLGEALFKAGDLAAAEANYRKALELNPGSVNVREMLKKIAASR
jgi:CubicO group peptidase (beta-lactamase class C family)